MASRAAVRFLFPPEHWRRIRTKDPLERIIPKGTMHDCNVSASEEAFVSGEQFWGFIAPLQFVRHTLPAEPSHRRAKLFIVDEL